MLERLVNAISELVATGHALYAPPSVAATLTAADPRRNPVGSPLSLDAYHLLWIRQEAVAARADADRSHDGAPPPGRVRLVPPRPRPRQ